MATTASGVTIPGSSPTTTAATPIQDHWNNLGKSLNGRVVVPVASVTARAALVSALTAEGYTISASNPLYTHRADATVGSELEYTVNGTTWVTFLVDDAWTTLTLVAGFTEVGSYPAQFRVSGGWCELRGIAQSSTSVTTSADVNLVAAGNAPAALSASSVFRLIAAITDGGATPLSGFATLNPRSDGGIRIRATVAGGVYVTLDGLRYRTS